MYVGNNIGALQYDGASWRLIDTASNSVVRSIARDAHGRLYVGSTGEIGYLAPDDHGQLHYVSLLQHVKPEDRAFNDVWTVHVTPQGIYFQSREVLLLLTPPADPAADTGWQVRTWKPRGRFLYAFMVAGTYYVHEQGVGLQRMVGDRLVLVPGSEQFAARAGAGAAAARGRRVAAAAARHVQSRPVPVRRQDVHAVRHRRRRVPARADAVQGRRPPGRDVRLLHDQRRPRHREPRGARAPLHQPGHGAAERQHARRVRRSHRAGVAGVRRARCARSKPRRRCRDSTSRSGCRAASPTSSGTRACCMPPPAWACSTWTPPRPPSSRSPASAKGTRRPRAWRRTATC